MFFDIPFNPDYLKYRGLYESLISEPQEDKIFNKDNTSSEEDQYIFWLYSISKEILNFRNNPPVLDGMLAAATMDVLAIRQVFQEAEQVILHGTVNHFSDKNFHILVKYDIGHEDRIIYLGSIFYKIVVGENMDYKINELGRRYITTGDQSVLFFISIYKSVLNLSRSDVSFSRQMINKIEDIAKNNGCLAIYTIPIGKMVEILTHYGFKYGRLKTVVYDARRDSDDDHYFNATPFKGKGRGRSSRRSLSRHAQKRKKTKKNKRKKTRTPTRKK